MSITLIVLATAVVWAKDCPEGLRAQTINATGADLEHAARTGAGDLCPDRGQPSTSTQESDLLTDIRRRTLPRLTRALADGADAEPGEALTNFKRLRLDLAARRADVVWSGGKLTVVPAVGLKHADGFAKLDQLQPAENARLQATFRDRVEAANARLVGASKLEASRIGDELRTYVRETGRSGYDAAIAADPSLLFVEANLDVIAARSRYQNELRGELSKLPALPVTPPEGEALALIFYGPAVAESLRARPELCGAFFALQTRARRNQRLSKLIKGGLDLTTSDALCSAASLVGGLALGAPSCLGNLAIRIMGPPNLAGDRYRERQLLYGGY